MIAVFKYTDDYNDRNIVFGILAKFRISIIKTDDSMLYSKKVTIYIEDANKIHDVLLCLNENTRCGVMLLKCKKTFKEKLKDLFNKGKKKEWKKF